MKAIIFPGQSSQYVGMGKSLYDNFIQAKEVFLTADNILGYKLSQKCFSGTSDELKSTDLQQLAILTVSLAAYKIFCSKGIKIDYLAGLSLGEYSCLYAAGVLSLGDLIVLVKERAQAMQEAATINPSTMLAVIGAQREVIERKSTKERFYLANINSSQQIVVSLAKEDKDRVKAVLEPLASKVIELEVSGGFHSPFMQPAKQRLQTAIATMSFSPAVLPIVSNVTAVAHNQVSEIENNLVEQLIFPVLWSDCIEYMASKGVKTFYEIGPSKVLRGLMRKIDSSLEVINIEKKEDLDKL